MSPNVTNKKGETSLGVSAKFGRREVAEILLAHGADPNTGDKQFGGTPLIWASVNGFPASSPCCWRKGLTSTPKTPKTA